MRHSEFVSSVVPPPTFRTGSGIAAFGSVLLVNIERSVSNASTGSALRPPVSGCPRCSGLRWPRLTCAAPSNRLATALARRQSGRSLRVRRATFLPYVRRIYAGSLRMILGLESMRPLAQQAVASDAVRVPRTRSLPSTSFRFRLAADTLAVRRGVPVITASTGTFIRPVASRPAFVYRFAASG
jgi:hypothetical protein